MRNPWWLVWVALVLYGVGLLLAPVVVAKRVAVPVGAVLFEGR